MLSQSLLILLLAVDKVVHLMLTTLIFDSDNQQIASEDQVLSMHDDKVYLVTNTTLSMELKVDIRQGIWY